MWDLNTLVALNNQAAQTKQPSELTLRFMDQVRWHGLRPTVNALAEALERLAKEPDMVPYDAEIEGNFVGCSDLENAAAVLRSDLY